MGPSDKCILAFHPTFQWLPFRAGRENVEFVTADLCYLLRSGSEKGTKI